MSAAPPSFDAPLTLRAQFEARAEHPQFADKVFMRQGDRSWTYLQYRDECTRTAHFLLQRLGRIDENRPGHVAMLLENHFELLSLLGGCGYAGLTLFGLNTGVRGDTLAGILNHSRARLLVIDERFLPELARVRKDLKHIAPENVLVLPTQGGEIPSGSDFRSCLSAEIAEPGTSLEAPAVDVKPENNLMVIYTSGTTGLPKGINNTHSKLFLIGIAVAANAGLGPDDVAYASMPLFHSNSIFLGLMPAVAACGSVGIRERFSASASARAPSRTMFLATGQPSGTTSASRSTTFWQRSKKSTAVMRSGFSLRSLTIPRIGCVMPLATARRRPTSTSSCAGSISRRCSNSMARPKRRSAPSVANTIHAVASERSPIRT